ncbi:hypothetical protein [Microbacterium gilvum]|uniref:Haemin-degrading HemS/ChuX domain-containing protein n=1 Tax=Microbacterium gilvum TaxID=1336204 RepID=A0ABP9AIW9_9MICO
MDAVDACGCAGDCPWGGPAPSGGPAALVLPALPLLEFALAVTGRPGVVMAQTGRYQPVTRPGEALAAPRGAIGLRVAEDRLRASVIVRGRGERMLRLASRGGEVVHTVRSLSPADALVIDSLDRPEARLGRSRPSARRGAASDGGDQLADLDAVIADGGAERRRRMAGAGRERAVSIDVGVIPEVLDHLCATELPLSAVVFADGAAQIADGAVQVVTGTAQGRVGAVLGSCTIDVDLAHVREALAVTSHGPHGPTSALELYAHDGSVLLLLTQLGIVAPGIHAAWQDIMESLPLAH